MWLSSRVTCLPYMEPGVGSLAQQFIQGRLLNLENIQRQTRLLGNQAIMCHMTLSWLKKERKKGGRETRNEYMYA